MKALLVHLGIEYPRGRGGHDLAASAELLPRTHPLREQAIALDAISDWAIAFRYPADDPFTAEPLPSSAELCEWLRRIEHFRNDAAECVATGEQSR